MQVIASKCQGNNVSFYGWHCFQHQVKTPLVALIAGEAPLRRPRARPAAFPVTPRRQRNGLGRVKAFNLGMVPSLQTSVRAAKGLCAPKLCHRYLSFL